MVMVLKAGFPYDNVCENEDSSGGFLGNYTSVNFLNGTTGDLFISQDESGMCLMAFSLLWGYLSFFWNISSLKNPLKRLLLYSQLYSSQ